MNTIANDVPQMERPMDPSENIQYIIEQFATNTNRLENLQQTLENLTDKAFGAAPRTAPENVKNEPTGKIQQLHYIGVLQQRHLEELENMVHRLNGAF